MSIKLKKLKIENFKCFSTKKEIDLTKLTILTGSNSSGKSSILHAILGAVQSGEFPFKFSPNGKYINMGDFKEISNKHLSKDIALSYTLKHKNSKSDYTFDTIWQNDKKNFLPELKSITLTSNHLSLSLKKNEKGYLLSYSNDPKKDLDYDESKRQEITDKLIKQLINPSSIKGTKSQVEKEVLRRERYIKTAYKKVSFKDFQIKDIEALEAEAEKKGIMSLDFAIDALLNNLWLQYGSVINVISSFRHHPERTYLEQSKDKLKVDKFGDGYIDQIMLWEKKRSQKFIELEKILRDDLNLLYSLKPSREIGGGRYELLVKVRENGTETSLFDVGFGLNQFIPIIVADLQLPDGSTLFVAEPEIHLHPDVQAKFADYLVKQIDKKKKNYIIETHSEYLLNRIRLSIVKGTLKESDLSVYYLQNNGTDTEVHKLIFSKNGEIKNAPTSFFETYLMDIRDIALNAE